MSESQNKQQQIKDCQLGWAQIFIGELVAYLVFSIFIVMVGNCVNLEKVRRVDSQNELQ